MAGGVAATRGGPWGSGVGMPGMPPFAGFRPGMPMPPAYAPPYGSWSGIGPGSGQWGMPPMMMMGGYGSPRRLGMGMGGGVSNFDRIANTISSDRGRAARMGRWDRD
jgi:hypothetical protein